MIVGASSGLGRALAEHYLRQGHRVALAARRTELLEELARVVPSAVPPVVERLDVCEPSEAVAALERMADALGGHIDLYLHCSGIGRMTPEIRFEDELPMLSTNVTGWTACVDWAFRRFLRQGSGTLAAITSFAANRGLGPAPAYSASKAFQAHYLEALRQHAAVHGAKEVRIVDLRPGFVDTPLLAHPERLFWVLSVEKAVCHIVRAVEAGCPVCTLSRRWRWFAPMLRLAPRWLIVRVLRKAKTCAC